MKQYTFRILGASLIVASTLFLVRTFSSALPIKTILLITLIFSGNGWLALFPFYKFKSLNPFTLLVAGTLIRNLTVGIIICFYYYHNQKIGPVFLISCIFAFVIIQSVEVYQLVKDPKVFSTTK